MQKNDDEKINRTAWRFKEQRAAHFAESAAEKSRVRAVFESPVKTSRAYAFALKGNK